MSYNVNDTKYHIGVKLTLNDIKLLIECFRGCDLSNSGNLFSTICLMSINNKFLPKKLIQFSNGYGFEAYLYLKQEEIKFTKDLKNIIDYQKFQKEAIHHFSTMYFLGLDYRKINEQIFFNAKSPFFMLYIMNTLNELAEGFLTKEIGEEDLDVLSRYNQYVGDLFIEFYPIFLENCDRCERHIGFPNEYLAKFLSEFESLATAYLINIERYDYNPKVVSEAFIGIRNGELPISEDIYITIDTKKEIAEAKRILDVVYGLLNNHDIKEHKLLDKHNYMMLEG